MNAIQRRRKDDRPRELLEAVVEHCRERDDPPPTHPRGIGRKRHQQRVDRRPARREQCKGIIKRIHARNVAVDQKVAPQHVAVAQQQRVVEIEQGQPRHRAT